ncbi:hypothetical protein P7C70_g4475, partial [Phenoliferia sp. Uapishka_3]
MVKSKKGNARRRLELIILTDQVHASFSLEFHAISTASITLASSDQPNPTSKATLFEQRQTPRPELDLTLPPRSFLPPTKIVVPAAYTPTSALSPAFNVGLTSAGVGLFVSAIKNSLDVHNKGAMGVFTRTGWIVGYFAAGRSRSGLGTPGKREDTITSGVSWQIKARESYKTSARQSQASECVVSTRDSQLQIHSRIASVQQLTAYYNLISATAGFVFSYVDHTVANLRASNTDGVAGAAGGCAAGFVSGIRTGSLPKAMGMCMFLGAAVGTYDLAGGQLGWEKGSKDREEREKDRMDFFKKRSLTPEAE